MSKFLFDSTRYIVNNNILSDFKKALNCVVSPSLDIGAILGVLAFNYPTGDRTLLNEVKRQPWLSEIMQDGRIEFLDIPSHGLKYASPREISGVFLGLLEQEACEAVEGFSDIYVLTSGGLDSRIVCGVLAKLYREKKISRRPICLTWSNDEFSRDYVYAKEVAKICGFEFQPLSPLTVEDVIENTERSPELIGCFCPPIHLHSMQKLSNLSEDSIVFAGSYGDSVGRAEFSGKHLIEIGMLKPRNSFEILKPEAFQIGISEIALDAKKLRERTSPKYPWEYYEQIQQGWYMRGMIAQAMDVVNRYCKLYQMFTSPSVYSYIWSLHPCCRTDEMYAELLESLDYRLARLPWARTNKALKGKTIGQVKGLSRNFQSYEAWISGPVYEHYSKYIDLDWFENTGVFSGKDIEKLTDKIRKGDISLKPFGVRPYELWLWLISVQKMFQNIDLAQSVRDKCEIGQAVGREMGTKYFYNLRMSLARIDCLRSAKASVCRKIMLKKIKTKYPCE
ncbi:MAG: hypothetical protein ACIAQZ_13715 [Sedimentisphaeraceae bacterium JB056]